MHGHLLKVMLFCIAFIFALSSFSQDLDSTNYVTDSDVERLVDKYLSQASEGVSDVYSEVKDAVVALAESLQQPAENIISFYVVYHTARGAVPLAILFFGILGLWSGIRTSDWAKSKNYENIEGGMSIMAIVGGILCLVAVIVFIADESIPRLLAPEYFVIQDILAIFK